MRNLAVVYRYRKKFTETEHPNRQAPDILTAVLGSEHTETAKSMWLLAEVLEARVRKRFPDLLPDTGYGCAAERANLAVLHEVFLYHVADPVNQQLTA